MPIYPAYELYRAAEQAAVMAQITLPRERLEQAVYNAVAFYDGMRVWKVNSHITTIEPEKPVAIQATYDPANKTLTATTNWPAWARRQLFISTRAFVLGDVSGNVAHVSFTPATQAGTYNGKLYHFRFAVPRAKQIRMVRVIGDASPLKAIDAAHLTMILAQLVLPGPPMYYCWDQLAKELVVIPQDGAKQIAVVEVQSCMRGKATGGMPDDFFGLVSANGDNVTGSQTRFSKDRHEGCLIYFSSDIATPTADATARWIKSVLGPQQLTLEQAVPNPLNDVEYRITAGIYTTESGFQLLKACTSVDVHALTGRGLDSASRNLDAAVRNAIRDDVELTSGTILDARDIPAWIQRSSGVY
ncbi:MAG: hypothetical protein RML36_15300 [Anaerolineae bacterium]|nr:hypothetical protein [Anaerolineae bacterium]